ncbi:MAG: DUF465 domain-containing protein [Paracoccaceae bacterium]
MSLESHLHSLKSKHASISKQIEEAERHPSVDGLELASMKKSKLKIKEDIERAAMSLGGE